MKTVKLYYSNGSQSFSDVNRELSFKKIGEYFVGKFFNRGVYPIEKIVKCVRIVEV